MKNLFKKIILTSLFSAATISYAGLSELYIKELKENKDFIKKIPKECGDINTVNIEKIRSAGFYNHFQLTCENKIDSYYVLAESLNRYNNDENGKNKKYSNIKDYSLKYVLFFPCEEANVFLKREFHCKPYKGNWKYKVVEDFMTNEYIYISKLKSHKSNVKDGLTGSLELNIVRAKDLKIGVFSQRRYYCHSSECDIRVRFDNSDIKTFKVTKNKDVDRFYIKSEETELFLNKIKESKYISFEVNTLYGGVEQYLFYTEGFNSDIKTLINQ